MLQLAINGAAIPRINRSWEILSKVQDAKLGHKVALIIHVAGPNLNFMDNGKGSLNFYDDDELSKALDFTIDKVIKQLKADDRKATRDAKMFLPWFCREINPETRRMRWVDELKDTEDGLESLDGSSRNVHQFFDENGVQLPKKYGDYYQNGDKPQFCKNSPDKFFNSRGKEVEDDTVFLDVKEIK